MKGGQKWKTALETLCYVSTINDSRMNEDGHKNGGSSLAMENPHLHKDEAENSGLKNLEEEETYEEGSMHYERAIQGEGKKKTKMDWLVDVAIVARGGEEEQEDGVTLFGLGHSPILNKAKVHRIRRNHALCDLLDAVLNSQQHNFQSRITTFDMGEEGMNKTTTLEAQNDVPAGGFEVGEGSGGGHGNGGDGEKDGSFTEKENTQLENFDEENEDDDLELEERLPSLGDGFYEIEAIRRKRYRKGKLEYFVKWLGWGEHANTWEPPDNLVGVPEIIEAFEKGLKTPKQQKRKRKHAGHQTQVKKRVERSATPYSLRCLKTSTANNNHSQAAANNHSAPASLSEQLPHIPDIPAFPQTVLFADEVENNGEGSSLTKDNHAIDNKTAIPPEEVPQNNEEKEYDPKLSELKATTSNGIDADKPKDATTNGNDAGNLAMQFQEAKVPPGETGMNDQPMAVCTELVTERNAVNTEPVQNGSGRSRGRPRKSLAKRFKIDSCADKPGNTQIPNSAPVDTAELAQTGATDNAAASSHTAIEPVKPVCDIVKIVKPVGYTPAVASTTQDVLVTFEAIRSDGSEVVVDNNHLKTYHPILLIDYYEQHLRYTPKPV